MHLPPAGAHAYKCGVRTADFHYELPPELIAQHPAPQRDGSRLLVLHRADGRLEHRRFPDLLDYVGPGDVLVLNDSRVILARLRGRKPVSGGEVEVLLVEENAVNDWWAMVRPGKRVRPGTRLAFTRASGIQPPPSGRRLSPSPVWDSTLALSAVVEAKNDEGLYRLRFEQASDLRGLLEQFGEVPLPPYIERPTPPSVADRERYQTVFAAAPGSVAAPTAGLHFTGQLLEGIKQCGVEVCFVTLHVGLGTFAPVKVERLEDHVMHEEVYEIPATTVAAVSRAKAEGRRVVAVGTTSVRVLETVAAANPEFGGASRLAGQEQVNITARPPARSTKAASAPRRGRTRLFLRPPAEFRVADALLTNFHLPESTLLMLVSAFASPGATGGRELILRAYAEAVRERYRFFSYGDAMLIL